MEDTPATEAGPAAGDAARGAGRGGKSAAAFRTITEVAGDLDLPQHVLRFWETKFPQVRPLKRGGGRRYYRPEDVALLRRIRRLLYDDGYTIRGVQKLLRQGGGRSEEPAAPDEAAAPSPAGGRRQHLESVIRELEAVRDLLRGPGDRGR